jgi:putative oxidoreductase
MTAALVSLVLRCGLAVVFLYAGFDKLTHWQESVDEVTSLRLPLPRVFATLTIVTQLVGGIMVVTGLFAGLGAIALAGFTIMATILGHRFWLLRGVAARREFTTALEHVAIVSGLLLLAANSLA